MYESSWLAGKDQLLNEEAREELICFCLNMESTRERYPDFNEQIECFDAEIFLSIPSLLVLKALGRDDEAAAHRRLVIRFCEDLESKLKDMNVKLTPEETSKVEVAILKDERLEGELGKLA